jgi:hypothetical protein
MEMHRLFRRFLHGFRRVDRSEEQSHESAEKKAIVGLYTMVGSLVTAAIGLGLGLWLGLLAHHPTLCVTATAALTPVGTFAGRVAGHRAWRNNLRLLAARPDLFNERQLARDEYREQLQDIALMTDLSKGERKRRQKTTHDELKAKLAALELASMPTPERRPQQDSSM